MSRRALRTRLAVHELESRITPVAGALDTSFSSDGQIIVNIPGFPTHEIQDVLVLTNGKVVAAGQISDGVGAPYPTVFRFSATGSPDTQFSQDGVATLTVANMTGRFYSAVLQPDGKVVAAGTATIAGNNQVLVTRFNPSGALDLSFNGLGYVVTNVSALDDNGFAVALQPDGKIVVAGNDQTGTTSRFMALRYLTNGTLDPNFDNDGIATVSVANATSEPRTVLIQADGKIVLAGASSLGSSDVGFALVRLNANGSLDNTFDGDGIVKSQPADLQFADVRDIEQLADGKLLAVGVSGFTPTGEPMPTLLRYSTNGSLDNSFDGDGILTIDMPDGGGEANALVIQSDGKIVVAGSSYTPGTSKSIVMRMTAAGVLDSGFGPAGEIILPGIVVTEMVPGSDDTFLGLALGANSKIIVAGMAGDGQLASLARYIGTSEPPPTTAPNDYSVDEDMVLSLVAPGIRDNDTVPVGTTATLTVASAPTHGSLVMQQDGSFTYTPNLNYHGPDSFSYFLDNGSASNTSTVSLTVNSINDLPVSLTDFHVLADLSPLDVPTAAGVLANDFDVDGQLLTVSVVDAPASGNLNLQLDGAFVYQYDPTNTAPVTFTYKANDGVADGPITTVTLMRGPAVTVNGAELQIVGTNDADAVRVRPAGGNTMLVELATSQGLIRQFLTPQVGFLRFTQVSVYLGPGNDWLDSRLVTLKTRAVGGAGNDVLRTGRGDDLLFGDDDNGAGAGNDFIDGGNGKNVVTVGNGNNSIDTGIHVDTIVAGNGRNQINSGRGNDSITAGFVNFIDAGIGNDIVTVGAGSNFIEGGAGNDTITAGSGDNTIDAGAGNDLVTVSGGKNAVDGGAGNDVLVGGSGEDVLNGGAGNDFLIGGLGADVLLGGLGNDVLMDGRVTLINPVGDNLAKMLAIYKPAKKLNLMDFTNRVAVEFDVSAADNLFGGAGTDWHWTNDALDVTLRAANEPLNAVV